MLTSGDGSANWQYLGIKFGTQPGLNVADTGSYPMDKVSTCDTQPILVQWIKMQMFFVRVYEKILRSTKETKDPSTF